MLRRLSHTALTLRRLPHCINATTPLSHCINATTPISHCNNATTPLSHRINATTPLLHYYNQLLQHPLLPYDGQNGGASVAVATWTRIYKTPNSSCGNHRQEEQFCFAKLKWASIIGVSVSGFFGRGGGDREVSWGDFR